MLLDEDPAALISSCSANFNITPDRLALSRISQSLSTLSEARHLRLSHQRSALSSLQRRLNTVQAQHSLTVQAHNPTEHASKILSLDTEKFRIAKQASELEIESERLESEVEGLRVTLEGLERVGVEGSAEEERERLGRTSGEEECILKLKVYRSLGIDIEADPADPTVYNKAVIRNTERGDVHVVNLDPKLSKHFYANYFWNTM